MTDLSNRFNPAQPVPSAPPILSVRGLCVTFDGPREGVRA